MHGKFCQYQENCYASIWKRHIPKDPGMPWEREYTLNPTLGMGFEAPNPIKEMGLDSFGYNATAVSPDLLIWVFPKNSGFSPQIIHLKIRFSIIFTIHFGGNSPIFWKQLQECVSFSSRWRILVEKWSWMILLMVQKSGSPVNNIGKYPIIYMLFQGFFYASQEVVWDFFHQQLRYVKIYECILKRWGTLQYVCSCTHQVFLFANHSRTDRFTPNQRLEPENTLFEKEKHL